MILRLIAGSILIAGSLWASRLDQARLRFQQHDYAGVLLLLGSPSPSSQPEVLALAGHSEFELGNTLAAASYFKHLTDPTSLYRRVQIGDKLDDFPELEKAYRQINAPPDFVRYIYARQLALKGHDAQALSELEKLAASTEFKDRAAYIKAIILARKGEYQSADAILAGLLGSENLALAQLAKLTQARLLYQQGLPQKSIEVYETLNYPDELGRAELYAGDLSIDIKVAQNYYQKAEKNITDKDLKIEVLARQDKNDEARVLSKAREEEIGVIKQKIASNDPGLLADTWILAQPEGTSLVQLAAKFDQTESLLKNTELAYEVFDIDMTGRYITPEIKQEISKAKANLEKSRFELANLKTKFADARQDLMGAMKPVWLARLDDQLHQSDEAKIQIGLQERLKLHKRIAQIEQVKATALKQAEEAFSP